MTRLYRLDIDAAGLARAFDAWAGEDPWAGGYVAPGSFTPVITAGREFVAGARTERGRPRVVPRIWGVPPPPAAADPAGGICTVRNCDSPFWIGNLRNSEFRCLVPATAFMEWSDRIDVEGRRERVWFAATDARPFAFAGVWKDSEVPSFAIVTCPANALLRAEGCERMPVILAPTQGAREGWLHGGWDRAAKLVAPCPAEAMRVIVDPAR